MKPVLTKRDFVRRYQAGEFGNASPTWNTYQDWYKYVNFLMSDKEYEGPSWGLKFYHLRNRIAGGPTWYNVSGIELERAYYDLLKQGVNEPNIYVSEMAPTHLTLFQGEVKRTTRHLDLYYSTYVAPMREALAKQSRQVYGILAVTLLKYYLDQPSYEWLNYLLDTYEDHVVEFSTYSQCWGTVPGMNSVFWEVRLY